MPNQLRVVYGICPQDKLCKRSYLEGLTIIEDFKLWRSIASMPGAGDGTMLRNAGLEKKCRVIFQAHDSPRGYCGVCGRELIFSTQPPQLGSCRCQRKYVDFDLELAFCPECGERIEIQDSLKEEIAHYGALATLLGIVPDLVRFGYL